MCQAQGWNINKLLKTGHQCILVLNYDFFSSHFIHFWPFLLLCRLFSNIFTIYHRGSEVCLERCDSYDNFSHLKNKINIQREICKRRHCPPIGTLALLLYLRPKGTQKDNNNLVFVVVN